MKINITTILYVGIAVLLTLQLKSCFDKVHKPESMIRDQERIKYLEEKRLSDSTIFADKIRMYDSLLSASEQRSLQLANKFQSTKVIYERIPFVVNNLDKEQLRAGANEY